MRRVSRLRTVDRNGQCLLTEPAAYNVQVVTCLNKKRAYCVPQSMERKAVANLACTFQGDTSL